MSLDAREIGKEKALCNYERLISCHNNLDGNQFSYWHSNRSDVPLRRTITANFHLRDKSNPIEKPHHQNEPLEQIRKRLQAFYFEC